MRRCHVPTAQMDPPQVLEAAGGQTKRSHLTDELYETITCENRIMLGVSMFEQDEVGCFT